MYMIYRKIFVNISYLYINIHVYKYVYYICIYVFMTFYSFPTSFHIDV